MSFPPQPWPTDDRPNILLIMGDEHAAAASEINGGPAATPHLAALAAEGTVFEKAYCNAPLCVPSRSSMLTGMMASEVDVFDLASALSSDIPTIAHAVRSAGYDAVLSGKMHFVGPDQLHGFREQIAHDIHTGENPLFPWPDTQERPLWHHPLEAGPGDSAYLEADDLAEHKALEYIRSRDNKSSPWLLCTSFIAPHWPYIVPRKYFDLYSDADIPMPHDADEDPADQHPVIAEMRRVLGGNNYDEDVIRTARRAYLAAITHVDDRIGRLMDMLRTTGQYENTVIIYLSDHGGMLGEHHLWRKMNFYEESVRVPLLLRHPAMTQSTRNRDIVSLLDVAPTICDIARTGPLPSMRGTSLLGKMKSENNDVEKSTVVAEYLAQGVSQPMAMIRRGRFKFIYYHGYRPSLFDLDADPHETNDLGEDPAYSEVRHELLQKLLTQWDPVELNHRVRVSHEQRTLIQSAEAHEETLATVTA